MATRVKVKGLEDEIVCQSLTFGYLYDVENDIVKESVLASVMDGTGLTENDIRALLNTDVQRLWDAIKKETYPELFDSDGNEIELSDIDEETSKKKV